MSEFIAEASVLVRPDTKAFRATLQAELLSATKGLSVTVPVNVKTTTTDAAKKSIDSVKVATDGVVNSTKKANVEAGEAGRLAKEQAKQRRLVAEAETRYESALRASGRAQAAGATAVSESARARARLTAAINANTAADQAWRAARRSGDAALLKSTASLVAHTSASQADARAMLSSAEAAAAEAAAREAAATAAQRQAAAQAREASAAAAARSSSLSQAGRGGLATGLTFLGARGATLAAGSEFLAGAAVVVGIAAASKAAASLEQQLAVLQVTAEATSSEMEDVGSAAKALGRDITLPGVSATDAAVAMTELAKAGLSVQDSIAGARGVLQLSIAAQIDLASATGLVANALSAFKLNGQEAVRVADLFSNASIQAQGSIDDFGLALKQSAGAAVIAGVSLEDTVALLTLLARNGLTGSDAGTSLRVALLRLASPTKRAREELKGLNVELRDAQGNIRPEAFAELGQELNKLSVGRRQSIIRTVFGDDATRAFTFLSREGADGLRTIQEELERQGTTADIAGAQTAGFTGKIENLKNQAQGTAGVLGEGLNPVLGAFVDIVAAGIGDIGLYAEALGNLKQSFNDLEDSIPGSDFIDFGGGLGDILRQNFETVLKGGPTVAPVFDIASVIARSFQDAEPAVVEGMDTLKGAVAGRGPIVRPEDVVDVPAVRDAMGQLQNEVLGQLAGLERAALDLDISGASDQARLENLRQQETKARRAVAIQEDRFKEGKVANESVRKAKERLLAIIREREQLEDSIAADAKKASDDAQKARNEADQAVLDSLGTRESRLVNAQIKAQANESLANDIKAAIALRNFFKRSIAEIRRTVKDAQTERAAVAAATRDYITARQEVADLYRQRRDADREERQAKAEAALEGFSLDVQIAEALGNRGAEIKAREREIAAIRRLMSAEKVGSNERKRLRLELITKQKELRELKGEAAKANQAFSEMTFEFLRTQQGFGANLLGNLIPLGAASGLVGNASSASSDFRTPSGITRADQGVLDSAGISGARAGDGAKATQMSVLIEEVRGLRRAVESYNRRRPDASATYALDTVYYADDHGGRAY